MAELEELLTTADVVRITRFSRFKVANLRESGDLPGINLGSNKVRGQRWRYDPRDVDRLLQSRRTRVQ